MPKRINTAVWMEKQQRWQIKVQKDGIRRSFTSSIPGRSGQREANSKADRWLDDGILTGRYRIRDVAALWLEEINLTTSKLNYRQNESIFRVYVNPAIGHRYVDSITEQDLQDIITSAYKKKLSYKYLSNIRSTMFALLKYARKKHLTTLHPENVTIPTAAKRSNKSALLPCDVKMLFETDQVRLNRAVRSDWYINAYRLYVVTGLRLGELAGLQHDDISGNVLTVNRAVNELNEITTGKNQNAHRSYKLPLLAVRIINEQRNMLRSAGVKSDWLFPTPSGEMTHPHNLYVRWVKYRDFNGLSKITLYELRHTFISICKGKLSKEELEPIVGHSKNMDTFSDRFYGHQFDDGRYDETARKIDDIFANLI